MAFVITSSCVGVCDTGCVDVCPCDCIIGPVPLAELRSHSKAERKRLFPRIQMFIDPAECIDCAACLPECPEDAIASDRELPPGDTNAARNAAFFERRDVPR